MTETDQRAPSPAELFEQFFGPSLFKPWTDVLLEFADPRPGERVLDLACATGIVARKVAPMIGDEGRVVGLDVSPDMLSVARRCATSEQVEVKWLEGPAEDIPLPDEAFDLVLCQQGVQFFEDPSGALAEAERVLAEGGRIALNVWPSLERHPVYRALLEAEARHLDADLGEVATPFMFGGGERLRTLLGDAGFDRIEVTERTLEVKFGDPERFVALTVMAGAAVMPDVALDDPDERAALVGSITRDCEDVLQQHRDGDHLRFPMPNFIATARA